MATALVSLPFFFFVFGNSHAQLQCTVKFLYGFEGRNLNQFQSWTNVLGILMQCNELSVTVLQLKFKKALVFF